MPKNRPDRESPVNSRTVGATSGVNRRTLISTLPAASLATVLSTPALFAARPKLGPAILEEEAPAELESDFPSQESSAVREVVGASHFSFEKVRALVDQRPELAKSSWDWGFGDWESALGAASHTGNRDIALYLMDNGARPNIFTAAMLGNLPAVEAFVGMSPGIQSQPGPHGITLRRHAELGGDAAKKVLTYLDELGDADVKATNLPLTIKQDSYVGSYGFGSGDSNTFKVTIGRGDMLMLQRGEDGTARTLFHQGDHAFHPAGAPSARIVFKVNGSAVQGLEVRNPGLIVTATRV